MELRNFLKQTKELRKSSIREEFKAFKMVYSFQATVAARGYHVYKNATWDQTKVGDKFLVEMESDNKSKEIDPYCCSIRTSVNQQIKTVGTHPYRNFSTRLFIPQR